MGTVVVLHVEIDDEKPLGPQVQRARAAGVPWKALERATGLTRSQMRDFIFKRPHKTVGIRATLGCVSYRVRALLAAFSCPRPMEFLPPALRDLPAGRADGPNTSPRPPAHFFRDPLMPTPFRTYTSRYDRMTFEPISLATAASYAAIAASVAGAGVGAASATGAIGPAKPKVPELPKPVTRASPEIEDARRRALVAESKTRGPASNYLTGGGQAAGAAPVSRKYLTGE